MSLTGGGFLGAYHGDACRRRRMGGHGHNLLHETTIGVRIQHERHGIGRRHHGQTGKGCTTGGSGDRRDTRRECPVHKVRKDPSHRTTPFSFAPLQL